MTVDKWLSASVSIAVAVVMILLFGRVAYKLVSIAGVAGVIIVLVGVIMNGYLAAAENESADRELEEFPPAGNDENIGSDRKR